MALVDDWQDLEAALPEGWVEARIRLTLEHPGDTDRALVLLAPLQPLRPGPDTLSLRIVRGGTGRGPGSAGRALSRLDAERLHGTIELGLGRGEGVPWRGRPPSRRLPDSWDAALATLPADWSDLLGEVELDSSDYLEPGALHMAPINPAPGRRARSACSSAARAGSATAPRPGWSAAASSAATATGCAGRSRSCALLSDTRPVGTQGPVWQLDGRMV